MNLENRYHAGRPHIDYRSSSNDNCKRFQKENPEIKITPHEFNKLIRVINLEYVTYILETGDAIKLPRGLGDISINKKDRKKIYIDKETNEQHIKLPIDWAKTQELGKTVYHFNPHTDGFTFKWYWFKYSSSFKQYPIWKLKPIKKVSRLLMTYLNKEGQFQKYHEYDVNHRNKVIKKTK